MMHPTRRAVLLFASALPVSWLLLLYLPGYWEIVLYGSLLIALAIALDAAFLLPRHLLDAQLAGPARCFLGDVLPIELAIRAPRHRRPASISVLLEVDGAGAEPPAPARLDVASPAICTLAILPQRRGVLRVSELTLSWKGRLGLVANARVLPIAYEAQVLPNARATQTAAVEFFARESLFGLKVQREKGAGTEFEALREYAVGMDSRFIDWKHSARHRSLLCKEFRTERNHHVVLGFDTGYLMQEQIGGVSRLDHAINAALLLGWVALRSDDVVGSFAFDSVVRHYRAPSRGAHAFAHLQRAAAGLPYTQEETNFAMGLADLRNRLKRRSLVVLMTEFVDTVTAELLIENIQRLARFHVVVFVTLRDSYLADVVATPPQDLEHVARAVVAFEFRRDRSIVLERLRRMGIHCIDVDASALSLALLNRYLLVKQKELL